MDGQWCLVQCKPNGLRRAQLNLERQGFRCFVPRERRSSRRSGKFVTEELPVFPGYVFVLFDPERGGWRVINSTYGVARLVSFGGRPAALPEGLVEALRLRFDGNAGEALELEVGDDVVVREGPFAEFIASVEAIAPDRRVHLLIDLMGRKTRIVVSGDKLRKS